MKNITLVNLISLFLIFEIDYFMQELSVLFIQGYLLVWIQIWIIVHYLLGITKPCTQLHPPPSTSTQLISASTQLSATLSTILNQNIARNWAISPNLGQKIKSYPFWLKIDRHGMLDVLIPNPELGFWNSDPKIMDIWPNLVPKIQSFPFCLKIGTHSISRMLILNPDLDFWNSDPKIYFWEEIWYQKFKVVRFVWKLVQIVSQGCRFRIRS